MTSGEWVVAVCTLLAAAPGIVSFWWLFLRQSQLKATTPVQITLNPPPEGHLGPQIVIATLLYATGEAGVVVENLGARIRHQQTEKVFSVWVIAGQGKAAGLLVDKRGYPASHFFLAAPTDKYAFDPGRYEVALLARIAGKNGVSELVTATIELSDAAVREMYERRVGVCFDLNMKSDGYVPVLPSTRTTQP